MCVISMRVLNFDSITNTESLWSGNKLDNGSIPTVRNSALNTCPIWVYSVASVRRLGSRSDELLSVWSFSKLVDIIIIVANLITWVTTGCMVNWPVFKMTCYMVLSQERYKNPFSIAVTYETCILGIHDINHLLCHWR